MGELIRCIRNVRAEYNIRPNNKISATIIAKKSLCKVLHTEFQSLVSLARLNPTNVLIFEAGSELTKDIIDSEYVHLLVQNEVQVYIPLSGLFDHEKEKTRLKKQVNKLDKEIQMLTSRLQSKLF